jgi:addiction module HigA family antidote
MSAIEFAPDYASPPGDTLLEALEERGMSQAELAERTGRPKKTINEIIQGKTEITPETALQLEYALGIPAHFWNNRERRYREAVARIDEENRLLKEIEFLKNIPVREMAAVGWLPLLKNPVEQLRAVFGFFGVASLSTLKEWVESRAPAFRQSAAHRIDPFAVAAWIRKGEIEGHRRECAPFDQQLFRQNLNTIRSLTRESVEVFEPAVKRLCAQAGVAVVFVPELPKTCAWGLTQWLTADKALIQLSLRYKTDDHLWFTFFHEAGHILLHGKRERFLESARTKDEREGEADQFAANFLISAAHMRRISGARPYSRATVETMAAEIGIAPGVLVGRLQHDRLLPRTHLNDLRRRLEFRAPGRP